VGYWQHKLNPFKNTEKTTTNSNPSEFIAVGRHVERRIYSSSSRRPSDPGSEPDPADLGSGSRQLNPPDDPATTQTLLGKGSPFLAFLHREGISFLA